MRGIGVARVERMETTSKKECVLCKAVVQVIVYKLSQLGVNR